MSPSSYRRGPGAVLVINTPSQGAGKSSSQGDGDGRQRSMIRVSEEDRKEILDMAAAGKVTATAPESEGPSQVGWEFFHRTGWAQGQPESLSAYEVLSRFVDLAPGIVENERCRRNVHAANPSPEEDDEMAEFVSKDAFDAHMQRIDEKIEGTMSRIEGKIDVALSRIEGDIKVLSANDESRKEEYKIVREELISLRTMIFSMTLGLLVAIFVAAFLGR